LPVLNRGGKIAQEWGNPLDALAWLAGQRRRWAGFLSYDLGRLFENIPARSPDDFQTPLFAFAECVERGETPTAPLRGSSSAAPSRLRSTFTRDAYCAAVRRVVEYIRAGDVFQVNLAQRFTAQSRMSVAAIYERLLRESPADYGGLLDFGDFALICNSPELFFRVTPLPDGRRQITTRPIKGTRPLLAGMETELRDSIKDQAELNMIVDLERNDLGRICEIGSIHVTEPRTIEKHPTLYHGVATIEGILRPDVGFVEILRAMFPGGSITGAPKIRAMEIIDWIAGDGSMEFNIAIRTMIAKDGLIHIPVGGGIVADSDPAAEYEETLVKARAMFAALGVSMAQT
jgi:para-aminobenzoate synthetase component 1